MAFEKQPSNRAVNLSKPVIVLRVWFGAMCWQVFARAMDQRHPFRETDATSFTVATDREADSRYVRKTGPYHYTIILLSLLSALLRIYGYCH